jgi:hypothetical protein
MRHFLAVASLIGFLLALVVALLNARDVVEFGFIFLFVAVPVAVVLAVLAALSVGNIWIRLAVVIDAVLSAAIATVLCGEDLVAWLVFFGGAMAVIPLLLSLTVGLGLGWLVLGIIRPHPGYYSECGCSGSCHCGKPYC